MQRTIPSCLNQAAQERPDSVALRFKRGGQWQTTTYQALLKRAWHVAELLAGLEVGQGDRVAIYLENSPEWFELYYGIVGIGAIAVPIDAKLREQEISHILHDCGISVLFCATRGAELISGLNRRAHQLSSVVVLGAENGELPSAEPVAFLKYEQQWEQVAEAACSADRAFDRMSPAAEDPASFIYTSGTTGRQKGAILTHHNFMANVEGISRAINIRETDNFMLVLPLHHSFAFTANLLVPLYARCQVSLIENLKTIKANMADCSPTVLLAVPLLLEKMLARILQGIAASKPASLMYRFGLAKVIGRKIHKGLGGALRLIVSGGAPISPDTLRIWTKLGIDIAEGYGITETAPVLACNPPGKQRIGTVGPPIAGVEIRIHEPNEEGVGEIITRGENVMHGYYNNPAETDKVLKDGWYYTGDLGRFDEKGYLVISGRKKSLIVNREGKNIYPEEVERQVLNSPYVLECLAVGYRETGEETGERVGLIAVPDIEVFDTLETPGGARLSDGQIEELMRTDIRKQLSELSDYKQPRRIQIHFEEFEKTTTQKIKRYLYAIDTATQG